VDQRTLATVRHEIESLVGRWKQLWSHEGGQPAPGFRRRRPAGPARTQHSRFQGAVESHVWFTKGMGCPFCRQAHDHLFRGYAQFRALGTEIPEATRRRRGARGNICGPWSQARVHYLGDHDYAARPAATESTPARRASYTAKTCTGGHGEDARSATAARSPPPLTRKAEVMRDDAHGLLIVRPPWVAPCGTAQEDRKPRAQGVRQIRATRQHHELLVSSR